MFGDINTSIYITPIQESRSQNELNRTINELETERIVAADRGNINRESNLAQKRYEAESLRDEIAAGFNKLYEASVVSTLFAYSLEDLDKLTKLLATEMSKSLVGIKSAWAMQEEAFQSNLPLAEDKIRKLIHLTVDLWEQYSHLLHQKLVTQQVFHLDLINKLAYQYYLITSIAHLRTITWLYLLSLVPVNL